MRHVTRDDDLGAGDAADLTSADRTRADRMPSPEVFVRIETAYADSLDTLHNRLARIRFKAPPFDNQDDALRTMYAQVAYTVLSNGRAVLALSRSGDAEQMGAHVRPMFEGTVRGQYIHKIRPTRVSDFFDIVPFEQMRDISDYSRRNDFVAAIAARCLDVLRARPNLLDDIEGVTDPSGILAGTIKPPYALLRKKLEFPDVASILRSLGRHDPGWKFDLYPTIYRHTSATIHGGVHFTTHRIAPGEVADLFRFDLEPRMSYAYALLMQGEAYILGASATLETAFALADPPCTPLMPAFEEHQRNEAVLREGNYL